MNTVYEIQNLVKQYPGSPRPANNHLNFSIQKGELTAVLGPNGAGKTTLVRQMLGLLAPTSGSILLFGQDIAVHPESISQQVSYMPQQGLGLAWSHLLAQEAVEFTARLRGSPVAPAAWEAEFWMKRLGIYGLGRKPLRRLSGGQKRLTAIACALAGRRPVLFLDEPTNDLDPQSRRRIWEILEELKTQGATIIVVTHNVLEVERVADRAILMDEGKIKAYETLPKLKAGISGLAVEAWTHGGNWKLQCAAKDLPDLIRQFEARRDQGETLHWTIRMPTLEDAYLQIQNGGIA